MSKLSVKMTVNFNKGDLEKLITETVKQEFPDKQVESIHWHLATKYDLRNEPYGYEMKNCEVNLK